MRIFKSKKIMIAAIAVFVISSIGLTTAALSSDQLNKSSKTNTPALGGLTAEELQSNNAAASETTPIVIIPNDDQTDASAATAASGLAELSADSAKQIVSAKTPGAVITKMELDEDDGKLAYDVKAMLGQTEYEYKIDAYTGVILKYETDVDDINDSEDIDDSDDMYNENQNDDEDEDDMDNAVQVDNVDDAGEND